MKKVLIKLVVLIVLIVSAILFFRDSIMKIYIEKKLNLEVGVLESSIKEKKIVLNNIIYKEEKIEKSVLYEIEKIEIYFKNISLEKKEVNILKTEIYGMSYRISEHKKNEIQGEKELENETQKNELLNFLKESTEKSYLENQDNIKNILENKYKQKEEELKNLLKPYKAKLLEINESEEGKNIKERVKKIKDIKSISDLFSKESEIKDILKNSKQILRNNSKEKEIIKETIKKLASKENIEKYLLEISDINLNLSVDSDIIDKIISAKINEELEEQVYKQVLSYRKIVEKIEKIKKEKNENLWKLNIEKLNIESTIFNTKLEGEILNISSDLSSIKDIVEIYLRNPKNKNKIKGEIDFINTKGDLNLNIEELSSENIIGVEKYLSSGNIFLQQNMKFDSQNIFISGEVKINDMRLNHDNIVDELLKNKDIIFKKHTGVALKEILRRIDYLDINYTYDSESRKILIKSNLKSKIDEIFKNSKNDIAKKVFENELLQFKNQKISELIKKREKN
ncbi:MAG: hypothetical protein ACRCVS_05620 [Fusobacteriaceae bacterium]